MGSRQLDNWTLLIIDNSDLFPARAHRAGTVTSKRSAPEGRVAASVQFMAELLHSIPLTQTSEQSPHIFVDTAGSPLSVYLDVNPEILARPRLTRLLRVGITSQTLCTCSVV